MKVLIAGGGTMGREIARCLPEHEVTIIENDLQACERIKDELPEVEIVLGSAARKHILSKGGVDEADLVVAVVNKDSKNLLIAYYAKKKDKKVIARVKEPDYVSLFHDLGIDEIISPEKRAAMDVVKKLVWE
ncbi:MAG: hypothetical protein GF334_10640 [Candidatus Altiarchaeales archaeon]|nr:hypothetical protein [Candidatus Altiarchaeales archaeon]